MKSLVPNSQSPMSLQTPASVLAKEPDKIAKAINEEARQNRIAAGTVLIIALLILVAWAFWVTEDRLHPTSRSADTGGAPVQEEMNRVTMAGSRPASHPQAVSSAASAPAQESDAAHAETIHADVYFDVARSRLSEDAKMVLRKHAMPLKEGTWSVLVQGYTDPQGPVEYNKALGLRRAEAVKRYLVQLGVPDSTVTAVSLGKEGAICRDETSECRQRNRRVHLEMAKTSAGATSVVPSLPAGDLESPNLSQPTAAESAAPE